MRKAINIIIVTLGIVGFVGLIHALSHGEQQKVPSVAQSSSVKNTTPTKVPKKPDPDTTMDVHASIKTLPKNALQRSSVTTNSVFNPKVTQVFNTNVKPNSLWAIGSVQKMMTAIIVQQLISEHKLTLDTKLSKFYPQFPHSQTITVDQLLKHQSGVRDSSYKPTTPVANESIAIEQTMRHMNVTTVKGYKYESTNYVLLAAIIMKVTNHTYANEFKQRIIKPLGLKHTFVGNTTNINVDNVVIPANKQDIKLQYLNDLNCQMSALIGAGNVYMSQEDLVIFLQAILNKQLIPNNITFFPTGANEYNNGMHRIGNLVQVSGLLSLDITTIVMNPAKQQFTLTNHINNTTFAGTKNNNRQLFNQYNH